MAVVGRLAGEPYRPGHWKDPGLAIDAAPLRGEHNHTADLRGMKGRWP